MDVCIQESVSPKQTAMDVGSHSKNKTKNSCELSDFHRGNAKEFTVRACSRIPVCTKERIPVCLGETSNPIYIEKYPVESMILVYPELEFQFN